MYWLNFPPKAFIAFHLKNQQGLLELTVRGLCFSYTFKHKKIKEVFLIAVHIPPQNMYFKNRLKTASFARFVLLYSSGAEEGKMWGPGGETGGRVLSTSVLLGRFHRSVLASEIKRSIHGSTRRPACSALKQEGRQPRCLL